MDTNKMREQFEAWVLREYPNQTMGRFSDGGYHSTTVQYCWLAWQASREAVVVELTAEYELPPTMDMQSLVTAIRQQDIATVEAQGLKVAP